MMVNMAAAKGGHVGVEISLHTTTCTLHFLPMVSMVSKWLTRSRTLVSLYDSEAHQTGGGHALSLWEVAVERGSLDTEALAGPQLRCSEELKTHTFTAKYQRAALFAQSLSVVVCWTPCPLHGYSAWPVPLR